jgi:hypothetical protein
MAFHQRKLFSQPVLRQRDAAGRTRRNTQITAYTAIPVRLIPAEHACGTDFLAFAAWVTLLNRIDTLLTVNDRMMAKEEFLCNIIADQWHGNTPLLIFQADYTGENRKNQRMEEKGLD